MHLVIISGAVRPRVKSNTAKIIEIFIQGYVEGGNTVEVYYLSDRKQWAAAKKAFYESKNILIAMPLYVENIPGTLLEFLTGLKSKESPGTHLAFLLQGGFPEASQSRCCEAFLETLPKKLGCEYGGTLIKGDMFGVGLVNDKIREKMLAPFRSMGRLFAMNCYFEKSTVDAFAAPEYMSKRMIRKYNLVGKHLSRLLMPRIAKKLGCKEKLDAQPLLYNKNGE